MKYILFLFLFASRIYSGSFTTPPTQITAGNYNQGVLSNIISCYNSVNNEVVITWDDRSYSGRGWYAIYNVKSGLFSTVPTQITNQEYTHGVSDSMFCCYNSVNNQVIFNWSSYVDPLFFHQGESLTTDPWYSIYDVMNRSFTVSKIPDYTQGVSNNVLSCYNSVNNQVVFSWVDASRSANPWVSIYDVASKSFTTRQIPDYTNGAIDNVLSCYNSVNNQVVFSWIDSSRNAWYSIYDIASGLFTTNQMPAYTKGVDGNVSCCYNNVANQIVFTWADLSNHNPWYSIYDVTKGLFTTTPTQISPEYYSYGVARSIYCCYNSLKNKVVFSWADLSNRNPWYCIYDVESSSFNKLPTQITAGGYNQGVHFDVFCSYNSVNNQVVFTWTNKFGDTNLWYAVYTWASPNKNKVGNSTDKFVD